MTSEGNGPNSVVVGPDGSIYYSNFGTRRDSTEPGYLADNTVGRITPDGIVETFAVLDNGVTAMALGPDGHLYVVTINARDRIWRVTLPDGDVSLYFDFADTPADVRGDNILGIAFGASGEIYATDYLENFIFGINFPGRSLYRVFPDADSNGRADGAELMSSALDYPVRLVFDSRTGDLIVNDSGRNRLVRFNTSGPPVLEVALTEPTLGAIFLHPSGHLLGFNDDGELLAFATDVSSGRTVILPEPHFVASGFYAPLDLTIDGAGNFVIPHFEDSEIIRLVMTPERPAEPVLLSLEHETEPGALPDSIVPADGVWSDALLRWEDTLASDAGEMSFAWTHELSDLVPGQAATLSSASTLYIEQGSASFVWEHGPLMADVGRMIGLSPSTRLVPRGSGQEVTVSVRNPLPVATTMTLSIDPLPEGLHATLPAPFTVNPGATVSRTIAFVAAGELPDPGYSYTVRVSEPGGAQDAATGYLELTDAPLRVEVLTPELSGTRGGTVQLRFRATRAPGDTRRAFYVQARGLDAVRGDSININTQLIDFYLTDGTVERTVSIPLRGRAGTYTFHLLSMPQENGGQYAPVEGAVGRITIVDDAHIPITVEPLLLRTPRGSQWSVEGAFTNHSNQARRLRVTACCGAIWGRVFDGGPFLMQPYETRRVTITGASGSLGVGPYAHEFRVVDVDDSTFSGVFTHTVEVVDTAFTMTTLPEPVLVADGTASFNVRIQRGGSPRPASQVAVSGPLTGGIDMPTTTIAEGGVFGTDLPVTLRGLEGFGRGPWPVYVTAWRVDAPDVIARRTIWLTIPAGDLSGSFDPERLILRPDESQTVLLTLRNDDLEESTAASLTWTAPGLAIYGLPEAVELLPGAERVVAIDVGAVDIGETALIVSLDYGGDRVDTLTLPVDVRANELPTAPTPVAPVDTTVGADVLFEWTEAADPEGDALVYTIEVLDTDDNEVFGLSLEATSTSTRLPYGNYRWRVRAADRYGAGDWSEWAAFVADRRVDNRAPAAPIIVAPENDATDIMRPVDVVWELAVDPDGDALLYTIEVSQTDDFASLFFVLDDIPASDDETITASVDGLGPGERWLARVRASDGLLTSDWSVVAFTTNNPPPSTPVLIAPVDGERVEPGEIALRFSTADDFDGQALRYVAAVYGDAERTEELWRGDGVVVDDEVVAAYDATGELGARFWSAWAIDELGAESEPAAVEEFNVGVEPSNNAPTAPTLLDPANGATVAPGDVELSWSAATDPDGDALTHTVWLLDGDGNELMRQTLDSDAPTLTWTVSAEAAGTYTWSVFATDARGLDGAEATPRTFVVTDPGEDAGGDAGADAGDTGSDAGGDAGTDADLPDVNEVDASAGPDADSGDDTTGGFGTAKNAGCCGVAGSGPRDAALWFVVGVFLLTRRRSFARAA